MRNTMITTLAEDYVRMARAKGLPGHRIMLDYAARNAILPNLTGFAMSLGFVVGGAILIEYVFNYQGVGYLLLQAVNNDDYPLMQALFLLITVAVLVAILLSDIATAILDPRTRDGEASHGDRSRRCPAAQRAGLRPMAPAPGQPAGLSPGGGRIAGARVAAAHDPRGDRRTARPPSASLLLLLFCLVALFPGVIAHDNPSAEIYPRQPRPVRAAPARHHRPSARTCSPR